MKINYIENLELSGYLFGLKQPSLQLNFQLVLPEKFDLDCISRELTTRFLLDSEILKTKSKNLSSAELNAVSYVWEVLGLTSNLLQTIKIPSFGRGIILDVKTIDENERVYLFLIQFPWVDHLPKVWVSSCLNWALKIVNALAKNIAQPDEEIQKLLEELHEKFVLEARKLIPGGGSTVPFIKTAHLLDIPHKHLNSGVYQIGWSSRSHWIDRSTTELDSAVGASISHNKMRSVDLLRKAAFPVPVHFMARTEEEAVNAARKLGFPVVIKPADKDRGEGVTVDIYDTAGVMSAYQIASELSRNVLVEKQVPGMCYRILVIADRVLYTVARVPIAVIGNGFDSIAKLISQANLEELEKAKHLRQKTYPDDELAIHTLGKQGYELASIPAIGAYAYLRPIETTEWGGLPAVYSDSIHSDNKILAIRAAKLFGLNIAGIDFITQDITKPWHQNGAIINEINYAPFIGIKYDYQKNGVIDMVQSLYPNGGRIPIEVFIGDDSAWTAALTRQLELEEGGTRAYVTSHDQTYSSEGFVPMYLSQNRLVTRCNALLMNRNVDAILLVIQTDELMNFGSPVDSINGITIVNSNICKYEDMNQSASSSAADSLYGLFAEYLIDFDRG